MEKFVFSKNMLENLIDSVCEGTIDFQDFFMLFKKVTMDIDIPEEFPKVQLLWSVYKKDIESLNPISKEDEWEKKKAMQREVFDYIKENNLIICVKAGLDDSKKEEIYNQLSYIPKDIIDYELEWIKTKYRDNYYFN